MSTEKKAFQLKPEFKFHSEVVILIQIFITGTMNNKVYENHLKIVVIAF